MDTLAAAFENEDEKLRLAECAREPIRTPARIQSHSSMLVLNEATGIITAASEDIAHWLGKSLEDCADRTLVWAAQNSIPLDPVRVTFEGVARDLIVYRRAGDVILEFETIVADMEYRRVGVVSAIERLSSITDVDSLRQAIAREIKAITEFDRVMVYHFYADNHGQVVADEREPHLESYLDFHFPASDIPVQARALYVEKRSRAIADTSDPGVALITADGAPSLIDLGATESRVSSPHHLEFMRNMGQASTVSFSLVSSGRLVGMITCAHNTPKRLPVLLRRSLEVLAHQMTMQITALTEVHNLRQRLSVRERRGALLAPLYGSDDVPAVLFSDPSLILGLVGADGAIVVVNDEVSAVGLARSADRLREVAEAVGVGFVTDALPLRRPELAVLVPGVAGLIVVSLGAPGDLLIFVRQENKHTVNWLGDQSAENRDTPLSPRRSFSAWQQTVLGKSDSWGAAEQEAFELGQEIAAAIAKRKEAKLAELALRDPLTGLLNRRYLDDFVENETGSPNAATTLLFIDLDNFKAVNDEHGHDVGDAVLIEVARRLVASSRVSDRVVRYGGDEFLVLCRDVTVKEANAIADRIVHNLRSAIVVNGSLISVRASCGVAMHEYGASHDALLEAADRAMYAAKRAGGDRVSLVS